MGARAVLVTGTVLSVLVTGAWSYAASMTGGPAAPVRLGRDWRADYAQLAAAPTGDGRALFATVAAIYALCFLLSGLRRRRMRGGA